MPILEEVGIQSTTTTTDSNTGYDLNIQLIVERSCHWILERDKAAAEVRIVRVNRYGYCATSPHCTSTISPGPGTTTSTTSPKETS